MKPTKAPGYVVYLLHFDEPVGKALHYLGICKADRLHYRLMEHRNSRGASLTARAMAQGIAFSVGATWYVDNPSAETQRKNAGHFDKHCALCQRAAGKLDLPVEPARYTPPPTSDAPTPLDGLKGSRISRY